MPVESADAAPGDAPFGSSLRSSATVRRRSAALANAGATAGTSADAAAVTAGSQRQRELQIVRRQLGA